MEKIKSYDKAMAYFLVTPDEMRLLAKSVLLELEHEAILKRALFSEMVFGQYCIRADIKPLNDFLCYVEETNCDFKDKRIRGKVARLAGQIREAFFNPEAEKEEEAKTVVSDAMDVIRSEEISRDPAYQELFEDIKALAGELAVLGADMRTEFLECYFCGARETDDEEGGRALLDFDRFPTGYTEMGILESHEDEYGDGRRERYIIARKFMCPACNMIQTSVSSCEC